MVYYTAKRVIGLDILKKVIGIISNILLVLFLVFIYKLDIIPVKFLLILIIFILFLITVINIFIFRINNKFFGIVMLIINIVIIIVLVVGINYLYITDKFMNSINDIDLEVNVYYVVVSNDSNYDDLEDLKGYTLGVSSLIDDDIINKLNSNTINKVYDDANILFDDLNNKDIESIFVSDIYYQIMCDEIDKFEVNTRIIYTLDIKNKTQDIVDSVDVSREGFNIYISGIDSSGNINNNARSDVNMIMTVNPSNHQILLTSIPRDYYVQLYGTNGYKDKLTHSGVYGVNSTIKTVEEMLDIDINYYIKVNFNTLMKVVDLVGGVDINSDRTFEARGCSFVLGNNHLDGKCALVYSRQRYGYVGGDRHRIHNQQDVMISIINKVTTSKSIITNYSNLLDSVSNSMQTNMGNDEISDLIRNQLDGMYSWDIKTISLDGYDSMDYTYSYPAQKLYVMVPDYSTINNAHNIIKGVINGDKFSSLNIN